MTDQLREALQAVLNEESIIVGFSVRDESIDDVDKESLMMMVMGMVMVMFITGDDEVE